MSKTLSFSKIKLFLSWSICFALNVLMWFILGEQKKFVSSTLVQNQSHCCHEETWLWLRYLLISIIKINFCRSFLEVSPRTWWYVCVNVIARDCLSYPSAGAILLFLLLSSTSEGLFLSEMFSPLTLVWEGPWILKKWQARFFILCNLLLHTSLT